MSGTVRIRPSALRLVNPPFDETSSRDRSRDGGTMQPDSAHRLQMGNSPNIGPSSQTAGTSIDLRAPVRELLGCAFRAVRNDGAGVGMDDGTHDAVRSVCAMAQANGMRAETLILAVKAGWRQLPESRGTTRVDAEATLAALITLCIKEYYAPQRRL